ncbi:MAG: polysaccharide biosynthesis tyrosine autokinase [Candidatus Promineofilum sp.]|nr:polysaccharide biosynthesis tyrosine autokinase [Promineifilum sp.]MBP9656807.1 polysaccharide biosynthesis tyrosine autokinase [Promineifilum sp.]
MELRAYIKPLLKWWWLFLASALLAGATSYYAVSQQPSIYQAHTTLLIGSAINNPNPTGNEFWLSQQLAQTYSDIARREVIQQAVMDELGLTWLPAYTAQPVADTQLLEIRVNDSSPERAMVVANELAEQLILRTPTSGNEQGGAERQAFISQQLDDLEIKIEQTSEEILAKQTELAGLFSARQIADAQTQIRALEAKQDSMRSNYASLLASTSRGAVNSLSIIEPAVLPKAPIGPEVLMTVLAAAAIGLSLGVGAAYLLEYLDDTIKSSEDIERATELTSLAGIADHKQENGKQRGLVTISQARSPVSESYRSLRTAVLYSNVDRQTRTMAVTSANPREGKSITSANLAVVLAQGGHRVLLIDADLRRPTQHIHFNKPSGYGLTNLLLDMPPTIDSSRIGDMYSQLSRAVTTTSVGGLYLMTSGELPPNPAELVGSNRMKTLIKALATRFDFIIIDTPPILPVTDAVVLGARVDSVLLVSRAGSTRQSHLKHAAIRLREVNANIVGVVLNRLNSRSGEYYHYYKGYYATDDGKSGKDEEPVVPPTVDSAQVDGGRGEQLRGILTRIMS